MSYIDDLKKEREELMKKSQFVNNTLVNMTTGYMPTLFGLGGRKVNTYTNKSNEYADRLMELNRIIGAYERSQSPLTGTTNQVPTTTPISTSTTNTTSKPKPNGGLNNKNRTWSNNSVTKQEPTYVDPDGVTHTGMTQDEFNQSMQMYEKDNEIWNARHAKVGDSDTTADELFNNALSKYKADPSSFSADQSKALWNAGVKLGYWGDDSENTQSSESSPAPSVTPTVGPTITSNGGGNSIASQVGGRYGDGSDLDKRTQGGGVVIPFSL